jgi:hypothetical protein
MVSCSGTGSSLAVQSIDSIKSAISSEKMKIPKTYLFNFFFPQRPIKTKVINSFPLFSFSCVSYFFVSADEMLPAFVYKRR